jgi:methylmalonyl-CoA mutase N-terminal domain/subunit
MRVTVQALAAVLGGTQSLHTNSFDEALALPSEEAATIALRTQQVIAYESGAGDTIDPLAGSYAVEALTKKIEEEAIKYLEQIDKRGGMVGCIEEGYINQEIEDASYRYQLEVENKERIIVGVNEFTNVDEEPVEILKINPRIEAIKGERLKELRGKRQNDRVKAHLKRLEEASRANENLMPCIVEAVRDYATIGEMSNALEKVYGRFGRSSKTARG